MPPQRNVAAYLLLVDGEGCMLPWANKYHLQALLVILLHPAININYHLHTSDDDELWRGFIEERWADKLSPYHREIIQHVRAALPSRLYPQLTFSNFIFSQLHGNEKKTFKEIFAFIAKKHDSNPGAALFSSAEKKRGEKSWLPSFPNIGRMLGTKNEKRIFMLGLDGAGMTTTQYDIILVYSHWTC